MIVKSIGNSGRDLPPACLDPRVGIDASTEFPLTIGKEYAVYAFTIRLGHVWYYITDDDSFEYPVWAPAPLFDVTDPAIPSGWHFSYYRYDYGQYPVVSFPEWADDPTFYERLVDGDETARLVFERYREAI